MQLGLSDRNRLTGFEGILLRFCGARTLKSPSLALVKANENAKSVEKKLEESEMESAFDGCVSEGASVLVSAAAVSREAARDCKNDKAIRVSA